MSSNFEDKNKKSQRAKHPFFEQYNVAFVSVTQDINTSSSSGRMMLNILMTFAQYEREVITERIKDKIAAAKKRGMNCGGMPPIGYISDPKTKILQIVPEEAELVKKIFNKYLQLGSAIEVAEYLNLCGHQTRTYVSRNGRLHGNKPYRAQNVYDILKNPIYIGLVKHYDKTYPGEHKAILDNATWYAAQDLLEKNLTHAKRGIKRISPLKDLGVCGYCGGPMGGTYTQKGKVKYRYYVCVDNAKHISPHCPLKRVPATELEDLLLKEIAEILDKPAAVASIMQEAEMLDKNGKHLRATTITKYLKKLNQLWDVMFPVEKEKFIHEIIAKYTVYLDKVEIEFKTEGLKNLALEVQ